MQRDGRSVTVTVSADGDERTVTHVGAALLVECAQRTGLESALSSRCPLRRVGAGMIRAARCWI